MRAALSFTVGSMLAALAVHQAFRGEWVWMAADFAFAVLNFAIAAELTALSRIQRQLVRQGGL